MASRFAVKKSIPLFVVLLLILAYGIYFSAYSIENHRALLTHASDLGQIDQSIWNTLHGHLLEVTRRDGTQAPRFTDHVEPLFILLSLVFMIYDDVQALLIAQSFAIAIGALAVFWIARKRLVPAPGSILETERRRDWLAVGFAAVYLLFPALEAANLAEFHAVTFAPALILFAYHFGAERKWGFFALAAFLALMVKEEISLLVFMLSAYFSVSDFRLLISARRTNPERSRTGTLVFNRVPLFFAILAIAWFALTVFVIIPAFSPLGKSVYTCRYIVSEECGIVARGLFLNERAGYLLALFASVGFVALFDPIALILGAPLILANVVSNYPAQYSGTFHYSAPIAPYLVLAAIGGTVRMQGWLQRARDARLRVLASPFFRIGVSVLPFIIALSYHALAGYTPIGGAFSWTPLDAHAELLARFTNQIPREAIVAATPALHPHLSHRRFLYRYSTALEAVKYSQLDIEYVLLDVRESVNANTIDFRVQYDELLKQGYGVADASDGYILLKRGLGGNGFLSPEFYSYFRPRGKPQVAVQVDFGDSVRLVGYDVLNDSYGRVSLRLYWQPLRKMDRNYYLIPFYLDGAGHPRTDIEMPPLTVLFWYPTSAWQTTETVSVETLPVDVGPKARIGLGVVDGDDFTDVNTRLSVRVNLPATLRTFDSNTWVEIGGIKKTGKSYQGE